MERALAARPDIERQLARAGLTRVEGVPSELEGQLHGFGTAAFVRHADGRHEAVGVRRGASSPRSVLRFVERIRAAHAGEIELDAEHWLEVGLPDRALAAAAEVDPPRVALELRVRALLALDEVAQAADVVAVAPPEHVSRLAAATVHLAARRPTEAVACLEDAPARTPRESLVLGRALLDLGQRERAYTILEAVASAEGAEAIEAAECLATAITGKDLHSDH